MIRHYILLLILFWVIAPNAHNNPIRENALENHVANNSGSSYTIENKSFGTVNNGVYTGEPVITAADGSKYAFPIKQ